MNLSMGVRRPTPITLHPHLLSLLTTRIERWLSLVDGMARRYPLSHIAALGPPATGHHNLRRSIGKAPHNIVHNVNSFTSELIDHREIGTKSAQPTMITQSIFQLKESMGLHKLI